MGSSLYDGPSGSLLLNMQVFQESPSLWLPAGPHHPVPIGYRKMDGIFNSFTSVLLLLCQNLDLGKRVAAWVSSQWIDPSGKELSSLTKSQSGPEAAYGLTVMHSGSSEAYPEELGITGYGFPCQGISRLAPWLTLMRACETQRCPDKSLSSVLSSSSWETTNTCCSELPCSGGNCHSTNRELICKLKYPWSTLALLFFPYPRYKYHLTSSRDLGSSVHTHGVHQDHGISFQLRV